MLQKTNIFLASHYIFADLNIKTMQIGSDRVLSLHRKDVHFETSLCLTVFSKTVKVEFVERRPCSAVRNVLRDITNNFFVILVLIVSHLSICSSSFLKWRSACVHQFHSFRWRINLQWLSKLRWLWMSIPWWVVCELISLMGSHTLLEQHSQPTLTLLDQGCTCALLQPATCTFCKMTKVFYVLPW